MMFEALTQRRYLVPFRRARLPQQVTDVLIIGAGVAGLRAAIAAADGSVAGDERDCGDFQRVVSG